MTIRSPIVTRYDDGAIKHRDRARMSRHTHRRKLTAEQREVAGVVKEVMGVLHKKKIQLPLQPLGQKVPSSISKLIKARNKGER